MARASRFDLYRLCFWNEFTATFSRWYELLALSFFLVCCVTIFAAVWEVTAPLASSPLALPKGHLLWYLALNEWLFIALPSLHRLIERDISSLQIESALVSPCSYLAMRFFEGFGELCASLVTLSLPTFAVAWFWTSSCPLGWDLLAISFLLGFFGGTVAVLCQLTIGLLTFWIGDITAIYWMWEKLLLVLGGLFLPLVALPDLLRPVSYLLPSYPILGGRSGLVLDGASWLAVLFSSLIWSLFLGWLAHCLWKRGSDALGEGR